MYIFYNFNGLELFKGKKYKNKKIIIYLFDIQLYKSYLFV